MRRRREMCSSSRDVGERSWRIAGEARWRWRGLSMRWERSSRILVRREKVVRAGCSASLRGNRWVPRGDWSRLSAWLDSDVRVEDLLEEDGEIEVGDPLRSGLRDDFRGGKRGFRVGVYE
jgi:hypothetical protein